jgi:hypothetical protein
MAIVSRTPGAIAALLSLLRQHAGSEAALEYVCGLLKKLASDLECARQLKAGGAQDLLKAVTTGHRGSLAAESASKANARLR